MPKKDRVTELYIHRLVDDKKAEAYCLLDNTIGLFLKCANSIVVALKAPGVIQIAEETEENGGLYIFGVTSSKTEVRNFQAEFAALELHFKSRLSLKDRNILVVQDYICRFIQDNLYEERSEKAVPFEFIIVQIGQNEIRFSIIDYEGNYRVFGGGAQNFDIIGCPDQKKLKKIKSSLLGSGFEKMQENDLDKLLFSITKPFGGELIKASFDFTPRERK